MEDHPNILHGPKYPYVFPKGTTIGQLLFERIPLYEDQVAQIQQETGEELKFNEIFNKSRKLAFYLRINGIRENDRIGIISENNLGWASMICATLFVGATICPLNPNYSEREFLHCIGISKPKYLFVTPSLIKFVNNCVEKLSWKPIVISLFDIANDEKIRSIDNIIAKIPNENVINFQITQVDVENHIVCILCSSGTTGLPKGVMLSERNFISRIQIICNDQIKTTSEPAICLLPFFHAACFNQLLQELINRNLSIIFSRFNEESFLATIEKYRVSVLALVPPLVVFLAKDTIVEKYDLSTVKTIWCGAAPLSSDIELQLKKRLKRVDIRQGYGMTETTLSVLRTPENCNKPGNAGLVNCGTIVKVIAVDENGTPISNEPLGPNCPGELCFKGDLIMKGYCDNVSATNTAIDKDGWLHTGDIGYYDNDKFFYIVDRIKELIKYKGFQVAPAELEAILLSHEDIKDAAVIGLPDEKAGELPLAFVVKKINAKINAEDIQRYVNGRVSREKRLRGGVRFLDSIPKNPSGKILRRELRALVKSKM